MEMMKFGLIGLVGFGLACSSEYKPVEVEDGLNADSDSFAWWEIQPVNGAENVVNWSTPRNLKPFENCERH